MPLCTPCRWKGHVTYKDGSKPPKKKQPSLGYGEICDRCQRTYISELMKLIEKFTEEEKNFEDTIEYEG